MIRDITIRMNLTDEQVSRIVPSGDVLVEIMAANPTRLVAGRAEILSVEDKPDLEKDDKC